MAGRSNSLLAPQEERLDLTAGKLSKQELDGHEIRPLVLVRLGSLELDHDAPALVREAEAAPLPDARLAAWHLSGLLLRSGVPKYGPSSTSES